MPQRLALLVATYRYEDAGLRQLTAPGHDAEALAAVLRDPDIAGFDVTILVNEPNHVVGRAIGEFYWNRRRDDLTFLYFTGHGVKDDHGRLYLAMTDTKLDSLLFTALSAQQIDDAMESCSSRQKVLVLDCCYSGAFPAGHISKADPEVHTIERFQGKGRVVLTASDATSYSFEGNEISGEANRSVFTRFLVEGLTTGKGDLDSDGDISHDELYSYVHDRVIEEMPQQRPKKHENVEGCIVVARNIHWSLPAHLRNAMESPISRDRLAALDGLAHLYRIGNDHVRAAVINEARRLVDDDSKAVSAAAMALMKTQTQNPRQAGTSRDSLSGTATENEMSLAAHPSYRRFVRLGDLIKWPRIGDQASAPIPSALSPARPRRRRRAVLVSSAALVVIVAVVAVVILAPGVVAPSPSSRAAPVVPGISAAEVPREIVPRIRTADRPWGIVLTRENGRAYVTNAGSDTVSVIDTVSSSVISPPIPVGKFPDEVAVTRDGSRVYVNNHLSSDVSVINTATGAVTSIRVGERPSGVAIAPDGSRVYVTNAVSGTVSVIDTASNAVTSIRVGDIPGGVAVSPDGSRVYVTNSDSDTVSVIDTANNAVIEIRVGDRPDQVAVAPDGSRVYVTNADSDTVSVIDTVSNVVTSVRVGDRPFGVVVAPDGSRVYVANSGSDTVSVLDTASNAVADIRVGDGPAGVAVDRDGLRVYVANTESDDVSVIKISDG